MAGVQPKKLQIVNTIYQETNLAQFANKLNEYRRATGKSQKELAEVLALHPKVLSRKLSPNSEAILTHPEIKQIIKTLAEWGGLVRRQEAVELLELMGLRASNFSDEEWAIPPLRQLETERAEPGLVKLATATPTPSFLQIEHLPSHNLPGQLTRFIGREKSLTRISRLLSQDFVRLVTLLGIGGMGKTRLALEIARKVLSRFEHGVRFVPLAGLTDPNLLATAIAQTLGVKESSKSSLLEELKNYLRDKHLLLVLDNFEQLVDAAPQVSELLEAAPNLKVLVTSRVILHLYGETEFNLSPLELPGPIEEQDLEESEAVSLFVERVRAINPDFELDNENGPVIARICARLDGLPLALELAAASTRQLSFAELLAQLEASSLEVLKGGARNLPVRHQALRNTLEWSYRLLNPEEQRWFFCLSLFSGGWTREAAHAVCSLPGSSPFATTDMLNRLAEKSLLTTEQAETARGVGEIRYNMLETVREYAQECLFQTENYLAWYFKHANYYLRLAEQSENELYGSTQGQWLLLLDRELNNFSKALGWLVGSAQFPETAAEMLERISLGLKLSGALQPYWNLRGYFREGYNFLKLALKQVEGESGEFPSLPKTLYSAAQLGVVLGDLNEALQMAEQSMELSQKVGDRLAIAEAKNCLASVAFGKGDFPQAEGYLLENIPIFQEFGNTRGVATSLEKLANTYRNMGDDEKALSYYHQSLDLYRQLGDKYSISNTLLGIAHIANMARDLDNAERYYKECLVVFQELGNKQGIANVYNGLGVLANHRGQFKPSREYYEQSLEIFRQLGNRMGVNSLLMNIGNSLICQGEDALAVRYLEQALALSNEINDRSGLCLILYRLGSALTSEGDLGGANQYLRQCIEQSQAVGDKQNMAKALRGLGDIAFLREKWEEMRNFYQEGLELSRPSNSKFIIARTLLSLALAIIAGKAEGDLLAILTESLTLIQQMGDKSTTTQGAGILVIFFASREHFEQKAVAIAGTLEQTMTQSGTVLEPPIRQEYARTLSTLKNRFGSNNFKSYFDGGKAKSLEESIAPEILKDLEV